MRDRQLSLPCKGRGGWRPNAGRPRGTGITHHGRDAIDCRHPVHLVWRIRDDVASLRGNRVYPVILAAIQRYCRQEGFRIVYACVLGNHIHLIAECDSDESLARAMLSLGTSIAMRVNRATRHRGAVVEERYFVRPLRTPTEVARAVRYVLDNETHHGFERREQLVLAAAETWLLRKGWMRAPYLACPRVSSLPPSAEQHRDVIGKRSGA